MHPQFHCLLLLAHRETATSQRQYLPLCRGNIVVPTVVPPPSCCHVSDSQDTVCWLYNKTTLEYENVRCQKRNTTDHIQTRRRIEQDIQYTSYLHDITNCTAHSFNRDCLSQGLGNCCRDRPITVIELHLGLGFKIQCLHTPSRLP